jgi:hypothetical protein
VHSLATSTPATAAALALELLLLLLLWEGTLGRWLLLLLR